MQQKQKKNMKEIKQKPCPISLTLLYYFKRFQITGTSGFLLSTLKDNSRISLYLFHIILPLKIYENVYLKLILILSDLANTPVVAEEPQQQPPLELPLMSSCYKVVGVLPKCPVFTQIMHPKCVASLLFVYPI